MKTLIWVGCFLGALIIDILLFPLGVRMGLLPVWAVVIFFPKVLCRKWDVRVVRKAAFAKGMSIRQYVTSIAPPSLIFACEAHKGDRAALKKTLKICVEEDAITKEISSVLFEMYK